MARFHFRCIECGETYREDPTLMVCPLVQRPRRTRAGASRGVLEVVLKDPADRLAALPGLGPPTFSTPSFPSTMPLPCRPCSPSATLRCSKSRGCATSSGWTASSSRTTPETRRARQRTGLPSSSSPKPVEYGLQTVATASTGNAATALAAVAAAAGVKAVVFVPAAAPPPSSSRC